MAQIIRALALGGLTIADRVDAYAKAFAKWPGSIPHVTVSADGRQSLQGVWVIGNDYRNKSRFYGAYPRSYLERVMALFPDVAMQPNAVLHVFSGSLPRSLDYVRCDAVQPAELQCSVYDLPTVWAAATALTGDEKFSLVLADPPYTAADAVRYGTAMVDRRRAVAAIAEVTRVGGHMVWLDTVWPMHRKTQWITVGRIMVQRSTNHRVRAVSIFERV